jgi:phosphopantothenoylcysteine synthetase/decarboxylase
MYLDIERKKEYVLLADSVSEINESMASTHSKKELIEQQSMLAEWENIHNKVLFDAVNDALDEFSPYGLRGPPAPWSG